MHEIKHQTQYKGITENENKTEIQLLCKITAKIPGSSAIKSR